MNVVVPEFWRDERVLVLGASGFIGTAVVRMLVSFGAYVTATGRNVGRLQTRLDTVDTSHITFARVDVEQPLEEQLMQCTDDIHYDVVIDAASPADPASFSTNPVGVIRANIDGAFHALEFVREFGGRLVYVSSGEVYGLMHDEHLVRENESGYVDILDPRSCYPSSKRAAETLCASYVAQFGVDVIAARPAHIFGPGFTSTDSRASAQFFRDAMAGKDIVLQSSGVQHRTFTYIEDCVSGILTVAARGVTGEAYNISNASNNVMFREFAQAICDAYGVNLQVPNKDNSSKSAGQSLVRASSLDDTKLRSLGWKPETGLSKGIASTIEKMLKSEMR